MRPRALGALAAFAALGLEGISIPREFHGTRSKYPICDKCAATYRPYTQSNGLCKACNQKEKEK